MREEGQVLEYQSDATVLYPFAGNILTIQEYFSLVGGSEAADELEELCFASAGAAQQHIVITL